MAKEKQIGKEKRKKKGRPKRTIELNLDEEEVAFVLSSKQPRLLIPTIYEDDDPVPEHIQLMCAMAILFQNDPGFRRYVKRKWNQILKGLETDEEFQRQTRSTKNH